MQNSNSGKALLMCGLTLLVGMVMGVAIGIGVSSLKPFEDEPRPRDIVFSDERPPAQKVFAPATIPAPGTSTLPTVGWTAMALLCPDREITSIGLTLTGVRPRTAMQVWCDIDGDMSVDKEIGFPTTSDAQGKVSITLPESFTTRRGALLQVRYKTAADEERKAARLTGVTYTEMNKSKREVKNPPTDLGAYVLR